MRRSASFVMSDLSGHVDAFRPWEWVGVRWFVYEEGPPRPLEAGSFRLI